MKNFLKKIIHPFYKHYHFWYHSKPRKYIYKKVWTIIYPTVFSPIHTQSTKIFLDYIFLLDLTNKSVLELGCGSGIISILSAYNNALVTATDINKIALNSLKKASLKQNLTINCIHSDLFQNIFKRDFDYIFINPPFYPKNARSINEKAWFCGEQFEYFEALFKQLPQFISKNTLVMMILSKDCKLNVIFDIALKNNLISTKIYTKKTFYDAHYIYKINAN